MKTKQDIQQKIILLETDIRDKICCIVMEGGSYKNLTELEKIPLRVLQAELLTLKDFVSIEELDKLIEYNASRENYCAAAGIKKVKEWLIQ